MTGEIRLKLTPEATISGPVKDETGEPLEAAWVEASPDRFRTDGNRAAQR